MERIIYIDTIDRYLIKLVRHPQQKLCAEIVRVEGKKYDHFEKHYGLANYCYLEDSLEDK